MLEDMIKDLMVAMNSHNQQKTERAYKNLERVGVDRITARYLVRELITKRREENE